MPGQCAQRGLVNGTFTKHFKVGLPVRKKKHGTTSSAKVLYLDTVHRSVLLYLIQNTYLVLQI